MKQTINLKDLGIFTDESSLIQESVESYSGSTSDAKMLTSMLSEIE
jgi:hypothetical protein